MTSKLLLAAIVAAFAVQAAAIASDDAAKDSAKSMAIAVDQNAGIDRSGIATQPAKGSVKPHNHNEFHKQSTPAADTPPVVAGAGKPLHDHGKTHKQQ